MKPLKSSSLRRSATFNRTVAALLLILSLFGFLDAAYLAVLHYRGADMVCGPLGDCGKVASSRYAAVGSVPISLIGAIYYLVIILLVTAYFDTGRDAVLAFTAMATVPGFISSSVLVYLQAFVLQAFCFYCLLSALASTGLFVVAAIYFIRR